MGNETDAERFYLHVIYEKEFFGWGLVFSRKGEFIHAFESESVEEIKSRLVGGIAKFMDVCYEVVDPANEASLVSPSAKISIDNLNTYFRRTFRDNSPWIDSASFFQSRILRYIDQETIAGNVLDLGSGGGQYLKSHGFSITRLDLFQNKGHYNCFSGEHQDNYVIGNARAIPFDGDSFDLVLCNFLLEHVPHVYEVGNEIKRVLKQGGKAILSIPSLDIWESVKIFLLGGKISLPVNHIRAFGISKHTLCESIPQFIRYLRSLDLSVVSIEGVECFRSNRKVIQKVNNSIKYSFPFKYLGAQTILVIAKR